MPPHPSRRAPQGVHRSTRGPLAVLGLTATLVLAGCLGALSGPGEGTAAGGIDPEACVAGPPTPRPAEDLAAMLETDHDHGDAQAHTDAHGMELVGHDPLTDAMAPGGTAGGYADFSLAGDLAFVASFGPVRGFAVVDISDPTDPVHLADFSPLHDGLGAAAPAVAAGSYWDVVAFPEGDLVVLSAQVVAGGGLEGAVASASGAGRGDQQGGGLYLVNVSDPADPVLESFTQVIDPNALIPTGVHNSRPFAVDGTWYVAATTANGATNIYRVEGEAPERTLRHVSTVGGIHDTAFQVHPFTDQPLLYTAAGGVLIWDMTDPADPEQVSFVPNGPDLQTYHQTIPMNVLVDGRHITIAGTESAEGVPMPYTILDTTDPLAPEILGQWQLDLPTDRPYGPYRFSSHNFDPDRGRLYAAHYHGGVWVVDISNATNLAEPFAAAFYQPHEVVPTAVPRTPTTTDLPAVWSANLHEDGYVYASDGTSGLYVLRVTVPPSPLACAELVPSNIP